MEIYLKSKITTKSNFEYVKRFIFKFDLKFNSVFISELDLEVILIYIYIYIYIIQR